MIEASLFDKQGLPPPPWRTDRLVLRPFDADDALVAHRALDQDEEVWRYDPGFAPSLDERRANIVRYGVLRRQFGFGPSAAFLPGVAGQGPRFVGQGGLNPYIYDQPNGTRTVEFEVMYKLARPFWGHGYAEEIARFWIDYAFDEVRLPRLVVCPPKANRPSVRLLERLGATIEDDWLDPSSIIAVIEPPPSRPVRS